MVITGIVIIAADTWVFYMPASMLSPLHSPLLKCHTETMRQVWYPFLQMKKQGPRKLKYLFKVSYLEAREARTRTSSDFGIWALKFHIVSEKNLNTAFGPYLHSLYKYLSSNPICWALGSVLRIQGCQDRTIPAFTDVAAWGLFPAW